MTAKQYGSYWIKFSANGEWIIAEKSKTSKEGKPFIAKTFIDEELKGIIKSL